MSFTDFLEKEVLDHLFGDAAYAPPSDPAGWYIALSTTTPNEDGTGFTEPASNYARQLVVNNATQWPAAAGTPTLKSNANAVQYPQAAAPWGVITHYGIFDDDDPPGGNLVAWTALDDSRDVDTGDTFIFPAGNIKIQLD